MDDLKPCPFCGAEAYRSLWDETVLCSAGCRDDATSIDAWNRRAPSPAPAAPPSEAVERLVEAARILSDWEYRLGDAAFEAKYPGVERHKIVVRFNDALAAVEKEMER